MSEQLGLDFVSAPAFRQVARIEYVLRRVAEHGDRFHADFPAWLEKNLRLWERYELEANKVWEAGHTHYSSRTIWEVMRHHTTLSEQGEFKLNNNWAPSLARLYLLMYPERGGFFELREATQ